MYYQRKEIVTGHALNAARQVLSAAIIAGVLEVIRTRVLEFVLVIEKEFGIDMVNDNDKKPLDTPSQEKIGQVFHTYIYGGTSIAIGNSGTTNQYASNVQPGDLEGLKNRLSQLGVSKELITDLDIALSKDADSDEQPGPHIQGWFGKLMHKVGEGTVQLVSATATTVVMAEVKRFLGLPPG